MGMYAIIYEIESKALEDMLSGSKYYDLTTQSFDINEKSFIYGYGQINVGTCIYPVKKVFDFHFNINKISFWNNKLTHKLTTIHHSCENSRDAASCHDKIYKVDDDALTHIMEFYVDYLNEYADKDKSHVYNRMLDLGKLKNILDNRNKSLILIVG